MEEQRWDDDRANQLLDAARVVLEAAGGWQTPEDDHGDDPASLLRFAELYFSEGVRRRIWPHIDLMNRGIGGGGPRGVAPGSLGAFARRSVHRGREGGVSLRETPSPAPLLAGAAPPSRR